MTPAGYFVLGFLTCSAISLLALAVFALADRKYHR